MIRTRGKNKGEHLTLHQFCNDWISATTDDGRPVIVTPTSVAITKEERLVFLDDKNPGTFWQEFWLENNEDTGVIRFIKAPRIKP